PRTPCPRSGTGLSCPSLEARVALTSPRPHGAPVPPGPAAHLRRPALLRRAPPSRSTARDPAAHPSRRTQPSGRSCPGARDGTVDRSRVAGRPAAASVRLPEPVGGRGGGPHRGRRLRRGGSLLPPGGAVAPAHRRGEPGAFAGSRRCRAPVRRPAPAVPAGDGAAAGSSRGPARAARGRAEAAVPPPTSQPFSVEQCRSDRDPPGATVLRAPPIRRPRRGSLDLRLRDVDWADVFGALHRLTGEAFLVDADVTGRVSVDFPGVELEEALTLLQKGGIKLSPGPLRRVSRARAAAARPALAADAAKITLAVKRGDVRDVLAALAEGD